VYWHFPLPLKRYPSLKRPYPLMPATLILPKCLEFASSVQKHDDTLHQKEWGVGIELCTLDIQSGVEPDSVKAIIALTLR
jgi:hypothetical protein